jgi:flagellar hook-associated protein 2
VNQAIQSADDLSSAFDSLSTANGLIKFTGTDHNGNAVSTTFVKTASSTIDDFLKKIETAYNGTVDATIDSDGKLNIADKISGTSKMSMSSLTIGSNTQDMQIATYGAEGSGVLSTGKDSFFSIENILKSDSSNTVEGVITGVTFNLKSTSTDPVTVTLARDSEAVQKKLQTVVDAYNDLLSFSKEETAYADSDDEDSTDGDLAGDSTVTSIVSQIRNQIKSVFNLSGTSGSYSTLTMFGLKTDTSTGEFSIDSTMFTKGFNTHYNDLLNIFVTSGTSQNTSITLGRKTSDTQSGIYELQETDDSTHVKIRLTGTTDWYTSDERSGDIVTFSDGPAKGLSITASSGAIGTSSTFTFSKGLSDLLDQSISKLNDSHNGLIALRQESLNKAIASKTERITKLTTQVEDYRTRLTKQYAAMEDALSTLKTQTSSIISSFSSSSE